MFRKIYKIKIDIADILKIFSAGGLQFVTINKFQSFTSSLIF